MSQPDDALDVLRAVWSAEGQTSTDLDEACGTKSCQKMADVGFDGLAGVDGDLHAAWRGRVRGDGKLKPRAERLQDLVLGPAGAPPPATAPLIWPRRRAPTTVPSGCGRAGV